MKRNGILTKLLLCALLLATVLCTVGCNGEEGNHTADDSTGDGLKETSAPTATGKNESGNNGEIVMVEIIMENGGVIRLELYPSVAPITVENFTRLADEGFYDGHIFHRVIKGFMIQGGDPTGTGMGGSGTNIKGEFSQNGVPNNIAHVRGVISMARSRSYDSASSQFFIMHVDAPHLDGQYAAFGKVIEGMDVVDAIAGTKTNLNDRPLVDQVIKTIRTVK